MGKNDVITYKYVINVVIFIHILEISVYRGHHCILPCNNKVYIFLYISVGCLFDYRKGLVWKVDINKDTLVSIFSTCYMSTTRSALLHFVLLRMRDFWLVKRVNKHVLKILSMCRSVQIGAD